MVGYSITQKNLLQKVESVLDGIRPFLKVDGGNVKVVGIVENKKIILEFEGYCKLCHMAADMCSLGIEESIKVAMPDIESIEVINVISGKYTEKLTSDSDFENLN